MPELSRRLGGTAKALRLSCGSWGTFSTVPMESDIHGVQSVPRDYETEFLPQIATDIENSMTGFEQ